MKPAAAQPSSLPGLRALAAKESKPIAGRIVHAGHGEVRAEPPLPESDELRAQLLVATEAACALATSADAQRAGYVLGSVYTQGVGTHWINWSLVDKPFDPARPAMLLYDDGKLAGFSYWMRTGSTASPEGFAGGADHWHRHYGLCFDAYGMLRKENLNDKSQCDGSWLNGTDIWMLHAWIVAGKPNAYGTFASLNPALCDRNVPDVLRCPTPE